MGKVEKRRQGSRGKQEKSSGKVTATGGCLCGAVHYEVRGPMREVVNCHCGQCRKFHGHFGAYSNCELDDLTVVGRPYLKWYNSSNFARRGFCGKCGSSLFWQRRKGNSISIAAGSLERPTRLKTIRHIFVADMGDYYKLTDRLEKLPGTMSR
ncbi:MAG: GFA family protein [Dongiaceae bacterium]